MAPRPSLAAQLTPATRMGLSIAVATGLYGISFGALAVAAGLSPAPAPRRRSFGTMAAFF